MKPQDITPPAAGEAAHTPALRYNGVVPMHAPRALDVGQIAEILSGDGEYWMDVYAPDFKTAQQRAAFIVRAANSHDKLVEAESVLCALVSLLGHKIGGQELSDRAISDPVKFARLFAMALSARDTKTFAQARAALAAAKEGK